MSLAVVQGAVNAYLREADEVIRNRRMSRITAEFVRRLSRALVAVDESMAKALRAGRISMDDVRRSEQAVKDIFGQTKAAFDGAFTEFVLGAGREGRDSAVREFTLGLDFGLLNEYAQVELQQHAFNASQMTMDRMAGDVMGTLQDMNRQGLGIGEMRQHLAQDFEGMRTFELDRVSRTELHTASQKGADLAYAEAGVEFEQWITAGDSRVRGDPGGQYADADTDHSQMHGQVIRVGGMFRHPTEGWEMQYPGDRDHGAPISAWIQCRCRQVPWWPPKDFDIPAAERFYAAA